MTTEELTAIVRRAARGRLSNFARYVQPDIEFEPFHRVYYHLLDLFAHGRIRRLIVQMPPQHGKSQGSSRLTPAFILGLNPDARVCICSYSSIIARDFNIDVQRIMSSEEYHELFPESVINGSHEAYDKTSKRTSEVFDVVGHRGSLRAVGRGGSLTSKTVDIAILDDVYKDYAEGNSPTIREAAWNWYVSVVRTRLHNQSQEMIVFTRWNEDDLIGRLEKSGERIVDLRAWSDLDELPADAWLRVNFEALKVGEPTEIDQRQPGEPLWPEMHSREQLEAQRALDAVRFQCLYQGNPSSAEGRLYQRFSTYTNPDDLGALQGRGNVTDTADTGTDNLCSICYNRYLSTSVRDEHGRPQVFLAVTDVTYTDEPIEVTTETVPMMMNRNGTQYANIESNNGGRAFVRIIQPKAPRTRIDWYAQTQNKESRIITNASLVTYHIVMPVDWASRWPRFYDDVTRFLRDFAANAHDDAPDCLTSIIEREITGKQTGIRRRN
jgi:predicted phage terminase large subunit-like protein